MHPILFRIPLPQMPLKLWWALAAIAAIAFVYTAISLKKGDRSGAIFSFLFLAGSAGAAYAFRATEFKAANLPIYSYGVMLGLSLVVGWYLSLSLADRDGLPKETMANCYVVTAIAAIAGSRLLYIATNLDEFNTTADFFALRRGGLVAYGGFIGGYLGSWLYLANHRIRLMPWADVAVPSLASGLFITRVGCYLFGCDFGKRLPDTAPGFLQKMGTFPHWAKGTLDGGEGSPAFVRHLELFRGTPLGEKIAQTNASLPVHPTQVYESVVGLSLLAILLLQRRNQKFRGQIFFTFVYAYGVLRFLLEILRDDVERGEYGPVMAEHVLVPGALLLLAVGFVFGMALGIKNPTARTAARIAAFVPSIAAYVALRPASFGQSVNVQLSTSQWIAFITAMLVSYFYAKYWDDARRNPKLAMSLGEAAAVAVPKPEVSDEDDDEEEEEDDAEDEAPTKAAPEKKRTKGLVVKGEKGPANEGGDEPGGEEAAPAT